MCRNVPECEVYIGDYPRVRRGPEGCETGRITVRIVLIMHIMDDYGRV